MDLEDRKPISQCKSLYVLFKTYQSNQRVHEVTARCSWHVGKLSKLK
jgi:hypothetical protein